MIDLVIRGGTVVTPEGERRADIAIEGERISGIGHVGAASREIDARGKRRVCGSDDAKRRKSDSAVYEDPGGERVDDVCRQKRDRDRPYDVHRLQIASKHHVQHQRRH